MTTVFVDLETAHPVPSGFVADDNFVEIFSFMFVTLIRLYFNLHVVDLSVVLEFIPLFIYFSSFCLA